MQHFAPFLRYLDRKGATPMKNRKLMRKETFQDRVKEVRRKIYYDYLLFKNFL